jgi:hypothetical protein
VTQTVMELLLVMSVTLATVIEKEPAVEGAVTATPGQASGWKRDAKRSTIVKN